MEESTRKQWWWIVKVVAAIVGVLILVQVFFMVMNQQIVKKWYITHQDPIIIKTIKRIEWPVNALDKLLKDINPLMKQSIAVPGVGTPSFNVLMSDKDIQALTDTFQLARDNTYMYDRFNQWRNVEVEVDGEKYDAKIKYYWQDTPNFMNTKKSFTIKFDDAYQTMKRIKFVLFEESVWVNRMYAYQQAKNTWLISIESFVGKLSFNGVNQGYYFVEEHIDENVLEKSGYSNSVVVKVWDAFNTFWESHNARHSFTTANLQVQTDNPLLEKQISYAFWVFMDAIKQHDLAWLEEYIDIDYRARFEALRNLIGDQHMIKGNNMKFFYNPANWKFYPIFRSEGNFESHQRVSFKPNESLEYGSYYEDAYLTPQWGNIVAVLNSDDTFRNLKYDYLYAMIDNADNMDLYNDLANRYRNVITKDVSNNYGSNYYHRDLMRGQKMLKANISLTQDYLWFARMFVDAEIDHDSDTITITISPDSMAPLHIDQLSISYTWSLGTGNLLVSHLDWIQLVDNAYYDQASIELASALGSEVYTHHLDEAMDISRAVYQYRLDLPDGVTDLKQITVQAHNMLTGEPLVDHMIETNISTRIQAQWLPRTLARLESYGFGMDEDTRELSLASGSYLVDEDLIIPVGYRFVLETWVQIRIDPGVSVLSFSPIDIRGDEDAQVVVSSSSSDEPYGVFGYIGDGTETSTIRYLDISWGSEVLINGRFVSGWFSLYFTDVVMDHVTIRGHRADDGLNIKYGEVMVTNTMFVSNFADQFDCDYCTWEVSNNTFVTDQNNSDGDGLDVSGSDLLVKNNLFKGFGDKWMSIGEGTTINLIGNSFVDNTIWIAIKDGSHVILGASVFEGNTTDISMYIKKDIFSAPVLEADKAMVKSLVVETDESSVVEYRAENEE